ncbi:hypothetical protein H4J55_04735 [Colwellia sp. MB3u-22]|nr:hypothetical protein [Colwellia sp. MB02u-7]MBA6235000.1 hypothetical protein [Colwellia sp. MB02u-11]MBA6298759.1 hypothetical protein [Colwellia sp. MB3u-22]MBA6309457.1 hypothetical protein [Colwellia sp. MB3u-64]
MPRRRELKGIAINFAQLLSGRNNDYLGYWAIGQLSLLAQENNVGSIKLDLINFNSNIDSPELAKIYHQVRAELNRLLEAQKIPYKWVKSILVEFSFNQEYQEKYHYWRSALGKHYLVTLKIETDLGFVNTAVEGGNVNPHDPAKEKRRGGF